MSSNLQTTKHALIRKAYDLSKLADNLYVHVDEIGLLSVRKIEPIDDGAEIAVLHCWSEAEGCGQTFYVPISAMLAVEVRD